MDASRERVDALFRMVVRVAGRLPAIPRWDQVCSKSFAEIAGRADVHLIEEPLAAENICVVHVKARLRLPDFTLGILT